jgi:hypothetical protein
MERLDDASMSFFVFFSQEGIFMDASYDRSCGGACGGDASARQFIKPWTATFAINAGLKLRHCRISQRATLELLRWY